MIFDPPFSNGMNASGVIGQPNLTTVGGLRYRLPPRAWPTQSGSPSHTEPLGASASPIGLSECENLALRAQRASFR